MKKFGRCFECKRLMPIKQLEEIEFYEYHLISQAYHHKLICKACVAKAEEIGG